MFSTLVESVFLCSIVDFAADKPGFVNGEIPLRQGLSLLKLTYPSNKMSDWQTFYSFLLVLTLLCFEMKNVG